MIFSDQRHSLFYLLANYHLIPLERLAYALRYQVQRCQDLNLSFTQILVAFNMLHHQSLNQLRHDFGELDEDPLGRLLVDTGRISPQQLQAIKTQAPATGASLCPLLKQKFPTEIVDLLNELTRLSEAKKENLLELVQKRHMAMEHFKRGLFESNLLEPAQIEALDLSKLNYLPMRFKPLLDVLIMNGDWPIYLQSAVLVESIPFEEEPLLVLLCRPGLVEAQVFSQLMYHYQQLGQGLHHPACLLVEQKLISRHKIQSAVKLAYQHHVLGYSQLIQKH